jgi:hypothetical protein
VALSAPTEYVRANHRLTVAVASIEASPESEPLEIWERQRWAVQSSDR